MSSQNQGVSLSSPADPPMRRKRGRPRKDETVQGDNSPVTPVSDNLNKNKQSVDMSDPASEDMVGQMVSGVIEGSFDAGYLLNVKVGDTNTHLRGVVFLPGRFTPITAANDVAPNVKMYKRKEIPFPFVGPQGHLDATSPSGKSEKPIEHKNDTPNVLDQGLHIGLQSGATPVSESQSASILIPPASNLPMNDTGLPLGQKVLQDLIADIGLQNNKAVGVGQDQSLQGFEAFKLMKGPNINAEVPKASASISATFTCTLPVSETVNLKPQVEHQAVSFDLKPQELFGDGKSLDLVNNQTPKFPEPEPQAISCEPTAIDVFGKQASKFPEHEPQVMPCESGGIKMFGKRPSKFPEPETQPMTCEPTGINMFGKRASKFPEPEPQGMPCEPAEIHMFGKQASKFAEPEPRAIPCEPIGIDVFGKQASKFPEPEPLSMHCEPAGINMFGKQASKFPEPETQPVHCEPTGINMFGKQASKFPEPETQPMHCEPTGINIFGKQATKFPEPEPQAMPFGPTGINMFGKQPSKFPDPQAMPCESTGINNFGKQASKFPEPELRTMSCQPTRINIFGKQASKFPEPEPQTIPCEPTGLNMFGKQASKFLEPEHQAIPCELTGLNMFGKQASSRQDIDISEDTQLELAKKIMTGTNTAHMDGIFASDATTTTTVAPPCSVSMTSLPIMIFGAETIPSAHKPAAEESVFPRMVVPEVSSSSMAINTNSVESNAKDAIPPAHS
ncbi:hypothetical protein V6Z12_A10G015600 [Gossypium hirsutum]